MARPNAQPEVTREHVTDDPRILAEATPLREVQLLQSSPPPGSAYPQPMMRSQTDGMGDFWSDATGIDFTNTEVLTRQEYKDEADLNILLARFGVNTPMRQMEWGAEIDDRIDLQTAMAAIEEAKKIQVPDELRTRFPNWQAVLNGAETGAYQAALVDLEQTKKRTEETRAKEEADKKSYEEWKANVRETPPIAKKD